MIILSIAENRYEWDLKSEKKFHEVFPRLKPVGALIALFADGAEYKFIIDNIGNIPYWKSAKSAKWTGDLAIFIGNAIILSQAAERS